MSVSADRLRRIVAAIWSTQLGLELVDADTEQLEKPADDEAVICSVSLTGDFDGLLIARCSPALSMVAATAAFAASGKDLGSTDVRDTISELTHMTAGNLKALLPGRTNLSQPHPLEDDSWQGETVVEVAFTLGGEPLIVTLLRC